MTENSNLFTQAEAQRQNSTPEQLLTMLADLHVQPPPCDCHQAEQCVHETDIECAECGVTYARGTNHVCGVDDTPLPKPSLAPIALAAVTEYFREDPNPSALYLCMANLRRALMEGVS